MPIFVTEFTIPPSSGWVDLEGLFPGKTVKVDPTFRGLVMGIGSQYATEKNLSCRVLQTETGTNDSKIMETIALGVVDANRLCSILAYLGGEGSEPLNIPEGKKEVNLILGYVSLNGVQFVLFVEHELENGVEEIHLHVRVLNCWGQKDAPMVLVVE